MKQSITLSELKKKKIIIQLIFLPFPMLAGLAIYSIKYPGHYFLISSLANINIAYAVAAIAVLGCTVELFLLLPIFKSISELQKP